jgi:hypothetical protein
MTSVYVENDRIKVWYPRSFMLKKSVYHTSGTSVYHTFFRQPVKYRVVGTVLLQQLASRHQIVLFRATLQCVCITIVAHNAGGCPPKPNLQDEARPAFRRGLFWNTPKSQKSRHSWLLLLLQTNT